MKHYSKAEPISIQVTRPNGDTLTIKTI